MLTAHPHSHTCLHKYIQIHTWVCCEYLSCIYQPLLQASCLCDITALPAALLSLNKMMCCCWSTQTIIIWCFLSDSKNSDSKHFTHSVAQFTAKYLGRAGPVWQTLYNQNANESTLSSDDFYLLFEQPATVFSFTADSKH